METIIDKHLQDLIDKGLNACFEDTEPSMLAPDKDNDEYQKWILIPSKATNEEIADYEEYIGYTYPESYKRFLKHKHFYELYISECSFCPHPVNTWRSNLSEMIFEGFTVRCLLTKA